VTSISQFHDERLAPAGLRATQYSILPLICELGAVLANELGRRFDLDRTSTDKNFRPLERADMCRWRRRTTTRQAAESA
jgi:DNA-binding MarR family transcriptional regulator